MKKAGFIILTFALGVYLAGCGKKQQSSETMQEPMTMEALSAMNAESKTLPAPEVKSQESKALTVQAALPQTETKLEPLPPAGPYKPTVKEIQIALKNAGYYTGAVDGKMGPLTHKAVEEFQKANGIKVDGKVGPKTWVLLSKHLQEAPAKEAVTPTAKKKAKKTLPTP